eukprot:CAMPEP_0114557614 /NCGR_PEP_ID=MMETSP0114-20121206/9928_1 /TAXON_ID=31324 /ORGANISM="Goniomonas sp, Strain m" /LENGTH=224 /DNA_ID=CAMNT_0001742921 /DNA_START=8 /DNA_END=682 /DNA_ORIENTATION=+
MHAPVPPLLGKDSYTGPKTPCKFTTGSVRPHVVTLVWFAGSGQCPDNELLRRMVNAFHQAELSAEIHGFERSDNVRSVVEASRVPVFLVGHSAGGGVACRLAGSAELGSRVAGVVCINAAKEPLVSPVPTLSILGENDGGDRYLVGRFERRSLGPLDLSFVVPTKEFDGKTTLVIARQGDHSVRYNADNSNAGKERASTSPETFAMNLALAKEIKKFILGVINI